MVVEIHQAKPEINNSHHRKQRKERRREDIIICAPVRSNEGRKQEHLRMSLPVHTRELQFNEEKLAVEMGSEV